MPAEDRYYRWLVDSAALAVIAVDRAFNVTAWNRTASQIFNRRPEEILGHPVSELVHSSNWPRLRRMLTRVLADQVVMSFDDRRPGPYGGMLDMAVMLSPILDDGGECVGVSGLVRDITTRKRLAEELSRAEKLASIGQMAGGVAHHFNNLLCGMTTRIEFALSGNKDTRQLERALRVASEAAGRMTDIVKSLLIFAKPHQIQHEPTRLDEFVAEFVALRRARLASHGVTLETELQPAGLVALNREHFGQVLENLLTNSLEAFAGRPGVVRIRTWNEPEPELTPMPNRTLSEAPPDSDTRPSLGRAKLEFSDNGPGIEPSMLGRIFEPFFTTKGAFAGGAGQHVGLGLAVAHAVVTEIGGRIEVASQVDRGATFLITVPLYKPGREIVAVGDSGEFALPRTAVDLSVPTLTAATAPEPTGTA